MNTKMTTPRNRVFIEIMFCSNIKASVGLTQGWTKDCSQKIGSNEKNETK